MHEGTVEEWISFGQKPDGLALAQQLHQRSAAFLVEPTDLPLIGRILGRDLVGHWIFQPALDAPRFNQRVDDAAGISLQPPLGEKRHDVDIAHEGCRPQRQIANVARSDADAVECAAAGGSRDRVKACHSRSLASALTAATAMALPPLRPRTTRNGTRVCNPSASLDSAAPTKPTGTPMMAAGSGAPSSSISSNRNSAVGALPMATMAPSRSGRQSSSAVAERVFPASAARPATAGSSSVQMTLLPRGSLLRVMPWATIFASHRIGAPRSNAARALAANVGDIAISLTMSVMPHAWMILTATFSSISSKPERSASARMIANELR